VELGLIPEGWQVQKLGELVKIQKGKKRQQFGKPEARATLSAHRGWRVITISIRTIRNYSVADKNDVAGW